MLYIAGEINSGLVGNTFVHQCRSRLLIGSGSVSVRLLVFLFREFFNSVALGPWLRIPPLSCTFLLRSVLPCAGPVRAMISDMLYVDPIQYNHIPTLVSLSICRLDL